MNRARLILTLAITAYLLTGLSQVWPGERAVVRRFGKVVAQHGPGLSINLPWGIDRVDRIPVDRVRRVTVGFIPEGNDGSLPVVPGRFLTGDHNLIDVQIAVEYSVSPIAIEQFAFAQLQADSLIARAAEKSACVWAASQTVDAALLNGKTSLPAWLALDMPSRIAELQIGVLYSSSAVTLLQPPESIRDAFDQVTRAQSSMATGEQEARQEASRRLRASEMEKLRLATSVEAYRTEQLLSAKAEARGFELRLAEYERLRTTNPNVLSMIWWRELGELLGKMKSAGRIELLDHRLGPDGLDVIQQGPRPRDK